MYLTLSNYLLYNKNMQKCTYLSESIKNGKLMRWTFMPLSVYIAPMKFYSKKGQDFKYNSLVKRALKEWETATKGKVRFRIVNTLLESNVNIDWKRVERKALGYCYFSYDPKGRLYGAEVSIGLSDGLVHQDYNNESEVYHTILHEIGHAIGLGHSPFKQDIMYTPHQQGICKVSPGDVRTINWLYTFPQGMTPSEIASKYGVQTSDIDDLVVKIITKESKSGFEKVKDEVATRPTRDLLDENEKLANIKKYHLAMQNIKIPSDVEEFLKKKNK